MSIYDKGFYTILGVALLLIAVAIPLALRRVPRNIVYGFRTRATLADDELWFDANAHFGKALIAWSLGGVCVAYLIHRFEPLPPDLFLPVSVLVLAAPALLAIIQTARHVRSFDPKD